MQTIKNVALAGASGHLGPFVLAELQAANFTVTVLTRQDSKSTFPSDVKVLRVDYDSVESLTSAFKDQDAVISTINMMGNRDQTVFIDAAAAAGVKRLIPSDYGADMRNAKARSLPCFRARPVMQSYLEQKVKPPSSMTYTIVVPAVFLDLALRHGLLLNNQWCDGGDRPFSGTSMPTLAKGIVAVLKHPEETSNKHVAVHEAVLTQRKMAVIAEKITGKEWKAEYVDTAELEQEGLKELAKEKPNFMLGMINLVKRSIFAEGYGGQIEQDDNELLGIKMMSDSEIEDLIRENLPLPK